MKATAAPVQSCLCQCGRTFRRPRSLPLCKPASDRVWAAFKAQARDLSVDEYQRAFNRLYSNPLAVAMLLAATA